MITGFKRNGSGWVYRNRFCVWETDGGTYSCVIRGQIQDMTEIELHLYCCVVDQEIDFRRAFMFITTLTLVLSIWRILC